jgi:hypothetical protein
MSNTGINLVQGILYLFVIDQQIGRVPGNKNKYKYALKFMIFIVEFTLLVQKCIVYLW